MPIPRRSVSKNRALIDSLLIFLISLEVYFKDSCSLLIVFPSKKLRLEISDKLTSSMNTTSLAQSRSPLLHRTPLIGKMSAKVLSNFRDELSTAQRKWQAREISNVGKVSTQL